MLTILRRWFAPRRSLTRPHHRRAYRPSLEGLEDRCTPAVLTVNSVADNTAADGALTLREAIQLVDGTLGRALTAAEAAQVTGALGTGDTVRFNLPAGPQTINLTGGMLSITKAVTVSGPGAGTLTVNGSGASRVFYVGPSFSQNLGLAVSLSGLTIAGGKDAYGGGLFNAVTLALSNVAFTGNTATTNGGGGVYNNGSLSLSGCTFTNNTTLPNGTSATSGGALLNITAGTVKASGCTFTGNTAPGTGSAAGQGGALSNSGTMTVDGSTISNNSAAFGGGGVYNGSGSLTLTNCTVSGNTVTPNTVTPTQGGGLLNELTGTVTLTNCTFSGNSAQGSGSNAGQGGGVYNSGGTLTVNGGAFTGNSAASDGGGLYTRVTGANNLVVINNATFANNNSASDGGAIRAHFSSIVSVTGCTFVGNTASSEGGAIDGSVAAQLTITNSTFTNNSAGSIGGALNCGLGTVTFTNDTISGNRVGGVYGGGINIRSTGVTLRNTIVAGNYQGSGTTPNNITGYNFSSTVYVADPSSSYNLIGPGGSGGLVNGTNHNQVGVMSPGLGPLAGNGGPTQTMALLPGSPAIDRGGNAFVTPGETDQRGFTRIVNGTVDIGAFEVQPPPGPAARTLALGGLAASLQAGTTGTITVTARSSSGATATGYTGTVHFTSSDPLAVLPADYTFTAADNGVHSFLVTLETAGTQSVTAQDTATPSIGGTQAGITVTPAAASTLTVAGFPNPTTAGVAGTFTVTARDAYGNTATGYLGTVHFTSTDPQAVLPANYAFVAADQGVHTFSATFNTPGSQTITAADTASPSVTGTHAGITVYPVATGPVLLVNSSADNTTADNVLTLREAVAVVDGTLGRALTPGEQAQITGTLGGPNESIKFNLPSGPQTITLTGGALDITQPVAVVGPGAALLTVNGNNADRVFIVGFDYSQNLGLNVAISGLTVSGGSATAAGKNYGGGLLNFGTLTLGNVTFTGNTAGSSGGGAVYNDGALTATGCTFSNNAVTGGGPGGAIQNTSSATLTVTGCVFTGNTATGGASGAGIANSGRVTVTGSSFTGNSADSNGGGIYNSSEGTLTVNTTTVASNTSGSDGGGIDNDGTAAVTASTLSGNSAASEGGGLASKGPLTLTNVTLYGNTATSDGGGLQSSGAATLTSCTVTANRVTHGSGGVFGGGLYAASPVKIFNTIVAGNFQGAAPGTTASDVAGTLDATSAFNLIGTGGSGGLVNGVNNNQVGVANPGLGPLANNGGPTLTVALLAGSPAIDRGGNVYVTAGMTDQRGLTRIVNGTVDIGAFEVQ